ncbi:tautomerase family protein [Streptomyces olivochromogenes]|uniref:Tautomerase n=1 Tax=Streptomyces olivochromogenes TaxID=1963 RepID=A0A250V6B5_STROL|nr:tautomerase family protein [Streptomyces olivochromogenes]KUN50185.1 tautomerase [Streptomyces olivochromogenes]GAX49715.1 tautomerase [Streptomyces olivochromogenes]
MPVYGVTTTRGIVSDEQKADLAAEITRIHSSVTGAPSSFVHVVFTELPEANVFTDSAPSRPLLIHGTTRAGRPDAEKVRLAKSISTASSEITGVPESRVLVIITDTPARFAVEGGRVLPEPGDEDDWLDEQSN